MLLLNSIDDSFLYLISHLENEQHLRQVLQTLREYRLYAKLSKSGRWLNKMAFLEYVILTEGIFVDPLKVEAVIK